VIERLQQVSDSPKAEMRGRWAVVRLTITTLVERKMHKDSLAAPLLQHLEKQLPNLGTALREREQLKQLLQRLDPGLLGRFFLSEPSQLPDTEVVAPQPPPTAPPPQPGIVDRIEGLLDALRNRVAVLEGARAHILSLEEECRKLRRQTEDTQTAEREASASAQAAIGAEQIAQGRVRALEESLKRSDEEGDLALTEARSLKADLEAARGRESEATKRLRDMETAFSKEREDLERRIQINADGRLQGFCNALGSSLRLLLRRIPDRGSSVPPDLGPVLLTRLHEVIDALEAKGIHVRPNRKGL